MLKPRFGVQMLLDDGWCWLNPSGKEPYSFLSKEAAFETMNSCFPDAVTDWRNGAPATVRVAVFPEARCENP
jgi:hypothetical protein